LTCGALGCGRKYADGTGGNNHAVIHYNTTKHPVVCKIGTVTPEGTADVYCYACDDKTDDKLVKHLAHFGIDVSSQQKTEKSLIKLNIELNLLATIGSKQSGKQKVEPLFGPRFTGIQNLGNSCYMASVLQVAFTIQLFEDYYFNIDNNHEITCNREHAECWQCQMRKKH